MQAADLVVRHGFGQAVLLITFYNLEISTWQVVDPVGEELFGRSLRLRVLLWVGTTTEAFYQGEAASAVSYSQSAVAKELDRLERLGMVVRYARPNNSGRQYYRREESPYWDIARAAHAALGVTIAEESSDGRAT